MITSQINEYESNISFNNSSKLNVTQLTSARMLLVTTTIKSFMTSYRSNFNKSHLTICSKELKDRAASCE